MNCNNKNNIASVKHPTEHEDSAKSRDVNSAFNELQQIACVFLGFCFHFSRSRVESFPLMKIKNYWQCFFHLPITPSIRPEWFLWWSENFVLLSLQFNRKKKKRIRRKCDALERSCLMLRLTLQTPFLRLMTSLMRHKIIARLCEDDFHGNLIYSKLCT